MAITNIHLTKHLNGSKVEVADLKVGLLVDFPSGLGGVFEFQCVELTDEHALFKCTEKVWDREFTIKLNAPDLTREELLSIPDALHRINGWQQIPTKDDLALILRASQLGYVYRSSHTQAHWSNIGIDAYRQAIEAK